MLNSNTEQLADSEKNIEPPKIPYDNNMMNFIKKHSSLPKYLPKNGFYPLYTDQVRPIVYNGHNYIKYRYPMI